MRAHQAIGALAFALRCRRGTTIVFGHLLGRRRLEAACERAELGAPARESLCVPVRLTHRDDGGGDLGTGRNRGEPHRRQQVLRTEALARNNGAERGAKGRHVRQQARAGLTERGALPKERAQVGARLAAQKGVPRSRHTLNEHGRHAPAKHRKTFEQRIDQPAVEPTILGAHGSIEAASPGSPRRRRASRSGAACNRVPQRLGVDKTVLRHSAHEEHHHIGGGQSEGGAAAPHLRCECEGALKLSEKSRGRERFVRPRRADGDLAQAVSQQPRDALEKRPEGWLRRRLREQPEER
eukprot:scaffold8150_cov116-Isochrysis_galbana.AAC.8